MWDGNNSERNSLSHPEYSKKQKAVRKRTAFVDIISYLNYYFLFNTSITSRTC